MYSQTDDDSCSTVSEFNSIRGTQDYNHEIGQMRKEIARLRSENEKLLQGKTTQHVAPKWMISTTNDIQKQWNGFYSASERMKNCILERKATENFFTDYEENEKAVRETTDLCKTWTSTCRNVKEQLGNFTQKLNEICDNNLQIGNEVHGNQPPNRSIEEVCDTLVGTMKLTSKWNEEGYEPPNELSFEKTSNGFYAEMRSWDDMVTMYKFKPDNENHEGSFCKLSCDGILIHEYWENGEIDNVFHFEPNYIDNTVTVSMGFDHSNLAAHTYSIERVDD